MTSFILNEEEARDWITTLIMAHELSGLHDANLGPQNLGPSLPMNWQPREPGQEDAVSALIHHAQHRSGVLAHSEHAEIAIQYLDDGNDWSYQFLLEVSDPSPITLVSTPKEVLHLGDDSATGINAAISILCEAAYTANMLETQLGAFVVAMGHHD